MNSHSRVCRYLASSFILALALGVSSCSKDEPATEKAPIKENQAKETVAQPAQHKETRPVQTEPPPSQPPEDPSQPEDEWLARFASTDLDTTFAAIAKGIRYEPYRGALRGSAATLIAGSGNSLDQSILLAEILRYQGYRVRYARARLEGENLAVVLAGLYPPRPPDLDLDPEYAPYEPLGDPSLGAAQDHFWIELYQADAWLPLDPSFPRARPGEAYAVAAFRYDEIPEPFFQRLKVSLWEELHDGTRNELGSLDETVAALGLQPLSVIIHRIPKSAAQDKEKSRGTAGTFGGLGGSLSGKQPSKAEETSDPQLVAVEHQRQVYIGGNLLDWTSTLVAEEDRGGYIRREWLEFEVSAPDSDRIRIQRELYRHGTRAPREPKAVRHYAISVVPGPITEEWLETERTRIAGTLNLKKWQRELDRARQLEPGSQATNAAASTLREKGNLAGIGAGHLVGLAHAAASDAMARQVAWANGVEIIWPTPRLLITSVESEALDGGGSESYVTLDLRLDRVAAVPYPGFPARVATLFQTARGIQNSILEGSVLQHATGLKSPVTTALLMAKAAEDGTSLLTLKPSSATNLDGVEGLPAHSSEFIAEALRSGHDIIIPQRATRLGNRDRWGWWEVNGDTGEVIGVMEDGQHQASTNYTFNLSKVGLDDRTGFVIGAIIGANSTLFTISGLMLKYGETSAAMIAEVEKYVKSIMCRSCPSKAGISAGASGGASAGNDCLKIEKKVEAQLGASASIGFCESYQEGFACASGLLLQGLTGSGGAKATLGGEIGVNAQVNCEQAFGGLKVDDSGYSTNGKDQIRN